MKPNDEEPTPGDDPPDFFAEALSSLRTHGSALLIVGADFTEAHAVMCEKLLGNMSPPNQRYLLVSTDSTRPPVTEWFPAEVSLDAVKVIDFPLDFHRSAVQVTKRESQFNRIHIDSDDLDLLAFGISSVISEFEDQYQLAPAEMRVCFNSLLSVIERFGLDQTLQLLEDTIPRITDVNGMGHFHLPLPLDSDVVQSLSSAFDAVVELKVTDGDIYQRWHLRDFDMSSEWCAVCERTD